MDQEGRLPRLRAGDSDREAVVARLSDAYQAGMLSLDEFSERTERAWGCVHLDELSELAADLPSASSTPGQALQRSHGALPATGGPRVTDQAGLPVTIGIMSGTERSGLWVAGGTHTAVAIMGGVTLDLREARFNQQSTTIYAVAIMGGIEVIVPPDVAVRIQGLPVMGGFGMEGPAINPSTLPPDAPVVTITGVAFWGGVGVRRLDYGEDD
ncbi:DUF1707 SHOCT-like domain-containing protein [Luteococcus sp. Sow4_B9]|uniref:DUF1707 SHOCT-like domain-containing protein n=1 Tax=Luteococcus sp. Sow4_B9 TaxID=3438792 RepID=UPI003F9D819E